jgi:hypothetical protein
MRWGKSKTMVPYVTTRPRVHFAWWPTRMDDGIIVWMEVYCATEVFTGLGPWDRWVEVRRWAPS